jgi:hypothetical protein
MRTASLINIDFSKNNSDLSYYMERQREFEIQRICKTLKPKGFLSKLIYILFIKPAHY